MSSEVLMPVVHRAVRGGSVAKPAVSRRRAEVVLRGALADGARELLADVGAGLSCALGRAFARTERWSAVANACVRSGPARGSRPARRGPERKTAKPACAEAGLTRTGMAEGHRRPRRATQRPNPQRPD